MKPLSQTLISIVLSVTVVAALSIYSHFDGLIKMKMGPDGSELIIDGRQTKSEVPPSLE